MHGLPGNADPLPYDAMDPAAALFHERRAHELFAGNDPAAAVEHLTVLIEGSMPGIVAGPSSTAPSRRPSAPAAFPSVSHSSISGVTQSAPLSAPTRYLLSRSYARLAAGSPALSRADAEAALRRPDGGSCARRAPVTEVTRSSPLLSTPLLSPTLAIHPPAAASRAHHRRMCALEALGGPEGRHDASGRRAREAAWIEARRGGCSEEEVEMLRVAADERAAARALAASAASTAAAARRQALSGNCIPPADESTDFASRLRGSIPLADGRGSDDIGKEAATDGRGNAALGAALPSSVKLANATSRQLRVAYLRAAARLHPDRPGGCATAFVDLGKAYAAAAGRR